LTRSRQTADWGSRAGLAKIVPTSVAVGSGTGSADTTGKVTFSGVSSISLSSVFSSAYSHYVIHLEITSIATADADIYLKLRSNTTDTSTAYYQTRQRINSTTTTITEILNGSLGFHIGEWDSGTNAPIYNSQIDIINPFESLITSMKHLYGSAQQNGNMAATYGAGHQGDSTSFNAFNIIASAGTMTGTLKVYGYN